MAADLAGRGMGHVTQTRRSRSRRRSASGSAVASAPRERILRRHGSTHQDEQRRLRARAGESPDRHGSPHRHRASTFVPRRPTNATCSRCSLRRQGGWREFRLRERFLRSARRPRVEVVPRRSARRIRTRCPEARHGVDWTGGRAANGGSRAHCSWTTTTTPAKCARAGCARPAGSSKGSRLRGARRRYGTRSPDGGHRLDPQGRATLEASSPR